MNIEKEAQQPIFKISLLAISLFIMLPGIIGPALPLMEKTFSEIPKVQVELLTTIPNFGEIFGLLLNPWLVRKIGPKRVILLGLGLGGIAGSLPIFINNFWLIFISRILLGIGVGVYNSLAVSLIMGIYRNDNEEVNKLLGYQNIMNNSGYIIAALAISYLVTLSWHAVFLVYAFALPILFLFQYFVKVPKKHSKKKQKEVAHASFKQKFPLTIVWIGILIFLIFIFYMALAYKLPSFIVDFHLGSESTSSLMMALIGFMGIPCGLIFNWLYQRIRQWIWPLCLFLNAAGFYMVSNAHVFSALIIGCIVLGIGFGFVLPYLYKWIDLSADPKWSNLDTTFILIMMDLGCTLSPFVMSLIDKTPQGTLFASFVFFTVLTVVGLVHTIYGQMHKA